MKVRQGFVSNSSSSSFMVAWERRITCLEDVIPWVSNRRYAERIYEKAKDQPGICLCVPPTENCETCEERFRCYTGELAARLREWLFVYRWGGTSREEFEFYANGGDGMIPVGFVENNKGRFIYYFSIEDGGMGGDELESDMRGDYLWGLLPDFAVEDVT